MYLLNIHGVSKCSKQFENRLWIKTYEVSGQLSLPIRYQRLVFRRLKNHWCVTVNNDLLAIFMSQAKMQLRQVNENQNNLKLIWGCDVMLWGHNEYTWCQRSILGQVWPLIASWSLTSYPNLWTHAYSLWPLKVTHALELTCDLLRTHHNFSGWCHTPGKVEHPKLISKLFRFSLTWRNCILAWLTIDCHTPVIFQLDGCWFM